MYSTLMFGIVYGSDADPSTEMKSTPFGGSAPIRFISDCWTIRCMNATGLPACVERAPHADVRHRTVEVVLHVVFARPHDLHRLADGLRRFDRVGDEVGFAAPAEPAAEIRRVDLDLVGRKTAGRDRRLVRSASVPASAPTRRSRSARTSAVQFIGSIVACARNGTS